MGYCKSDHTGERRLIFAYAAKEPQLPAKTGVFIVEEPARMKLSVRMVARRASFISCRNRCVRCFETDLPTSEYNSYTSATSSSHRMLDFAVFARDVEAQREGLWIKA